MQRVVSRTERNKPRSGRNRVNIALPFSIITTEEPTKLKVGDWAGLAGLVITIIGFSAVIRQLIRIARAAEAVQASDGTNRQEADPLAADYSSPDAERL